MNFSKRYATLHQKQIAGNILEGHASGITYTWNQRPALQHIVNLHLPVDHPLEHDDPWRHGDPHCTINYELL